MKKNINISVSGIAFTFEYYAYERLKGYLSLLSNAYSKEEASVEIIADIEARISELILSWQRVSDETVTLECIDKIIEQMGPPDVEPSANGDKTESKYSDNMAGSHTTRRLYRNSNGSILGGVINGIAAYFGKDVTLFRILFIIVFILFFIPGDIEPILISIAIYIGLWCIIPTAKNARQKMEMTGKPITVESLRKNIENEFDSAKPSSINKEIGPVFSHILLALTKIIRFIFISIPIAIGVILVLALIATIGATVFALLNDQTIVPLFVTQNSIFVISTLSIAIISTLTLLLYIIAKLIFSLKYNSIVIYSLSIILIISWGVTSYIIVDNILDYRKSRHSTISHTHKLPSNKLVLNPIKGFCYGMEDFDFKRGVIRRYKKVCLKRDASLSDSTIIVDYFITTKAASTSKAIEALNTSSNADLDYRIDENSFSFDEYIRFNAKNQDKYKSRHVSITIRCPESMYIENHYRYFTCKRHY